jgi:hypothetical protein
MVLLYTVQARMSRISNLTCTALYWRHSGALKSFFVNWRPRNSLVQALHSTQRPSFVVFYFGWKGGEHSHSGHLHYDTVYSGRRRPVFRTNKALPSAGMGSDIWTPKVEEHSLHFQGLSYFLSQRLKLRTELLWSAICSVFITTKIMSTDKHD